MNTPIDEELGGERVGPLIVIVLAVTMAVALAAAYLQGTMLGTETEDLRAPESSASDGER